MNTSIVYMTADGLEKLKNELNELLQVRRPAVAQRIKDAREMGDISENAEYDAARQEQAFVEGRISELEEVIKNAQVISDEKDNGVVRIGSKVTVRVDSGEETFYIVGAQEANPLENKISHESPIGASLVGKKVGESLEVEAPLGKVTYKIIKIE